MGLAVIILHIHAYSSLQYSYFISTLLEKSLSGLEVMPNKKNG